MTKLTTIPCLYQRQTHQQRHIDGPSNDIVDIQEPKIEMRKNENRNEKKRKKKPRSRVRVG
jgi:hypothetical protein